MLFYLVTLGSICLGLAFYSIFITPWHYLQKDQPPNTLVTKLKLKLKEQSRTAKAHIPKTRATKAQIEQTETCRRAGVRDTL